jgi:hypothetical protein
VSVLAAAVALMLAFRDGCAGAADVAEAIAAVPVAAVDVAVPPEQAARIPAETPAATSVNVVRWSADCADRR